MPSYRKPSHLKIFYKINQYITAPEIRLVDEDAKQIGIMSITEARAKAVETGLDLVEIAPKAKPPVVKLIEFAKFKYQEAKKLKAEKRGIHGGELKEIQMTPFIGNQDFATRAKQAREFLTTGNKVRLNIKFQGRQIQRQEFGHKLADRFKEQLADISAPEGEAKLIGKQLIFTLTPVKKKNEKTKPKAQN